MPAAAGKPLLEVGGSSQLIKPDIHPHQQVAMLDKEQPTIFILFFIITH